MKTLDKIITFKDKYQKMDLIILAAKEDKDLKTFIQDKLDELLEKAKKDGKL